MDNIYIFLLICILLVIMFNTDTYEPLINSISIRDEYTYKYTKSKDDILADKYNKFCVNSNNIYCDCIKTVLHYCPLNSIKPSCKNERYNILNNGTCNTIQLIGNPHKYNDIDILEQKQFIK